MSIENPPRTDDHLSQRFRVPTRFDASRRHGDEPCSTYEIYIGGDPALHASHGQVWIEAGAEQVWLALPDRFGTPGAAYNFAPTDWARIVELINGTADADR